jgi:hypothetical protein
MNGNLLLSPLYSKTKVIYQILINYRGILGLSPFAKLFEKILQRQILDFFNSNELFHKSQHGFRSGFSCETALQELITNWRNNINSKLFNLALFVDLKKAFD